MKLFFWLGLMGMLNATTLPPVGYGTWPNKGKECTKAVKEALKNGYTILDTATFYNNFEAIAEAIKDKNREELTIISKVWPTDQSPDDLKKDLEKTLQRLNTPYIDIYLLHWPNSAIPIQETLKAMEELRRDGKIREIGVSNFTTRHLKKALKTNIPISWNQIEVSPQFYDPELLAYCHDHGIKVQGYSPIGRGDLVNDPKLCRLGSKYGKTPSQIALRWCLQHQVLPLPSSKNPKHIAENLDVYDFELTSREMEEINTQAKKGIQNRLTPEKKLDYVDEFDFTYDECWPQDTSAINKPYNFLMTSAHRYISTLQKIGSSEKNTEEILVLCSDDCKKVRNGELLFAGKEYFPSQLDEGKKWLGSWSITLNEIVISTDSRCATIRYELTTENEGDLVVMVILHFDSDFLISEINEVHNTLNG